MIDSEKQYTYNGRPVRVYADGSDTVGNLIHCSYFMNNEWYNASLKESDLVEVWQPKDGEIVWKGNELVVLADISNLGRIDGLLVYRFTRPPCTDIYSSAFKPEQFTGTLPEAFKGVV